MATPNQCNPAYDGLNIEPIELKPGAAVTSLNQIPIVSQSVFLLANTTAVTDFIVLPLLSSVPNGHIIVIQCGAANCEMRTPSASTDLINNVDCSDDAVEYLMTATQVVKATKISNTVGWMVKGWTAIGASATAVVPD